MGFDISKETISKKRQSLFSGKKKKKKKKYNISKCRLLEVLPRMLSVKQNETII